MMPRTTSALLIGALLVIAAALLWPRPDDPSVEQARENGYRAARSAIYHRQLAAVAMDSLVSARLATDRVTARAHARIDTAALHAQRFESLPVRSDSSPRIIVGPVADGDSLVSLTLARIRVQMVADEGIAAVLSIEAAAMVERVRSDSAIAAVEKIVTDHADEIASLKVELKAKSPPWYKRGSRGVEAAGAGGACATAGWILGGPIAGVGAGVTCAFIAGVVR